MNDKLIRELDAAWDAWDEKPGYADRALRMETACRAVSAELSLTATELRIVLAAMYRTRRDRGAAIERTIAFFTVEALEVTGREAAA